MSTAALPATLSFAHPITPARTRRATAVRRRPTMSQGMALESLGHAVEYLIDSRMFLAEGPPPHSDDEAIRLLMRHSREVFASCTEIVPLRQRLAGWAQRLRLNPSH